MTYRPRPSREALILAAVDLAMSDEAYPMATEEDRADVLELLLECAGVPEQPSNTDVTRHHLATELVELALILDEADVEGLDGARLRDIARPGATLAQRDAELDHLVSRFRHLTRTTVESLPPATIARP